MELQAYDYEIIHKPGKHNTNADSLSRREYPGMESVTSAISKTNDRTSGIALDHYPDGSIRITEASLSFLTSNCSVWTVDASLNTFDVDLVAKQRECPDFKDIISYLEYQQLPDDPKAIKLVLHTAEQFELLDNVLANAGVKRLERITSFFKLLYQRQCVRMPFILIMTVMQGGCHKGLALTYETLRRKYYWPKMYQEVNDYVKSCEVCQRSKPHPHARNAPLLPMPVVGRFARLHIDFVGPLTTTPEGHNNVCYQ